MNEGEIRNKYKKLTMLLIKRQLTITTMESITGGQIASLITDTEGSSSVLKGAFVTYSNEAKILQGVPAQTIDKYGVYSKETARAMAKACRSAYKADIGIGITGSTANIDLSNKDSVPGQVYFAVEYKDSVSDGFFVINGLPDRLAYKLYAAGQVVDKLFSILL